MKSLLLCGLLALTVLLPLSAQEPDFRRIEFKSAAVGNALRLLSTSCEENLVASTKANEVPVSIFLKNCSVASAIKSICRAAGLWYRFDAESNTYFVVTLEEFQQDNIVYREEKFRVFPLSHPRPDVIAEAIASLFGRRASVTFSQDEENGGGVGNRDQLTQQRGRANGQGARGQGANGGLGQTQLNQPVGQSALTPAQREALRGQMAGALDPDAAQDLVDGLVQQNRGQQQARAPIFISVLREQNIVVARTSDLPALKQIEDLIAKLDRPVAQVLLEMKILEVEVGDDFRSVFDFDLVSGGAQDGPASFQPRNPLDPAATVGASNILGLGNFNLEPNTLVYQFLSDDIRARLQLLKEENKLEAIATPMLLATNNRLSRLELGGERLFVTGVDVVTNTTTNQGVTINTASFIPVQELRDIGDRLEIIPKIADDDTVTLELILETSTIRQGGSQLILDGIGNTIPVDTRDRRFIRLTMVAKDGFTVALGGLIRTEVAKDTAKIPVLGDIPIVGALFRREVDLRSKRELVILITPRIVGAGANAQSTSLERGRELSDNPWLREGDKALEKYFRPDEEDETEGERKEDGREK